MDGVGLSVVIFSGNAAFSVLPSLVPSELVAGMTQQLMCISTGQIPKPQLCVLVGMQDVNPGGIDT